MICHEIDYKIYGDSIQIVEIELDPLETVIAEAGAMIYMENGIEFNTRMGDGSAPSEGFFGKLLSMGSRILTGESAFITHFTHRGSGKGHVAFSAPYPGTIVPVDMATVANNRIYVQKDSFLCAALGTNISIYLNQRLGAGLLGGEGFIMQKIQGDGMIFAHAGGTMIEKRLNDETLRIDTGCIVGYEDGIDFNIERAGGLKSMLFGGEGLFMATLSGTGRVWLQSMPLSKLVQVLAPYSGNGNFDFDD